MTACALANGQPWVDEIIVRNWSALTRVLPPHWLPKHADGKFTRRESFKEYGCGHYGCVFETPDPDAVFKVTTDESEADFVALWGVLPRPPGVVTYHGIWDCAQKVKRLQANDQIVQRSVYVLVRESADDTATLGVDAEAFASEGQTGVPLLQFANALVHFKALASQLRSGIRVAEEQGDPDVIKRAVEWEARNGEIDPAKLWHDDGGLVFEEQDDGRNVIAHRKSDRSQRFFVLQRDLPKHRVLMIPLGQENGFLAAAMGRLLKAIARQMGTLPTGQLVGQALAHYLDQGLLLADVHTNNVGLTERTVRGQRAFEWVITDPGHVVRLREGLPRPRIPLLGS